MAKASAKIQLTESYPYSGFWREHWTLTQLVHNLSAREPGLKIGDDLRVILVKDKGQETLFLQGEEVVVVRHLLEGGTLDDEWQVIADNIYSKLAEDGAPSKE